MKKKRNNKKELIITIIICSLIIVSSTIFAITLRKDNFTIYKDGIEVNEIRINDKCDEGWDMKEIFTDGNSVFLGCQKITECFEEINFCFHDFDLKIVEIVQKSELTIDWLDKNCIYDSVDYKCGEYFVGVNK